MTVTKKVQSRKYKAIFRSILFYLQGPIPYFFVFFDNINQNLIRIKSSCLHVLLDLIQRFIKGLCDSLYIWRTCPVLYLDFYDLYNGKIPQYFKFSVSLFKKDSL